MKKSLITLATTGAFNSASANTNAQAPMSGGGKLTEKYYGNGLYCNQFTCHSDSRQLWNSVFEISRNVWINSLPKLGTGGGVVNDKKRRSYKTSK